MADSVDCADACAAGSAVLADEWPTRRWLGFGSSDDVSEVTGLPTTCHSFSFLLSRLGVLPGGLASVPLDATGTFGFQDAALGLHPKGGTDGGGKSRTTTSPPSTTGAAGAFPASPAPGCPQEDVLALLMIAELAQRPADAFGAACVLCDVDGSLCGSEERLAVIRAFEAQAAQLTASLRALDGLSLGLDELAAHAACSLSTAGAGATAGTLPLGGSAGGSDTAAASSSKTASAGALGHSFPAARTPPWEASSARGSIGGTPASGEGGPHKAGTAAQTLLAGAGTRRSLNGVEELSRFPLPASTTGAGVRATATSFPLSLRALTRVESSSLTAAETIVSRRQETNEEPTLGSVVAAGSAAAAAPTAPGSLLGSFPSSVADGEAKAQVGATADKRSGQARSTSPEGPSSAVDPKVLGVSSRPIHQTTATRLGHPHSAAASAPPLLTSVSTSMMSHHSASAQQQPPRPPPSRVRVVDPGMARGLAMQLRASVGAELVACAATVLFRTAAFAAAPAVTSGDASARLHVRLWRLDVCRACWEWGLLADVCATVDALCVPACAGGGAAGVTGDSGTTTTDGGIDVLASSGLGSGSLRLQVAGGGSLTTTPPVTVSSPVGVSAVAVATCSPATTKPMPMSRSYAFPSSPSVAVAAASSPPPALALLPERQPTGRSNSVVKVGGALGAALPAVGAAVAGAPGALASSSSFSSAPSSAAPTTVGINAAPTSTGNAVGALAATTPQSGVRILPQAAAIPATAAQLAAAMVELASEAASALSVHSALRAAAVLNAATFLAVAVGGSTAVGQARELVVDHLSDAELESVTTATPASTSHGHAGRPSSTLPHKGRGAGGGTHHVADDAVGAGSMHRGLGTQQLASRGGSLLSSTRGSTGMSSGGGGEGSRSAASGHATSTALAVGTGSWATPEERTSFFVCISLLKRLLKTLDSV